MTQCACVSTMDADLVELIGHALCAGIAATAQLHQPDIQHRIIRVDAQPDDMDGRVITPGHGNFDAIHKAQPQCICRVARFGQPGELIVIGQCQQFHAVGMGAAHQFGGRQQTVGCWRKRSPR